jgi:hypothetical protein
MTCYWLRFQRKPDLLSLWQRPCNPSSHFGHYHMKLLPIICCFLSAWTLSGCVMYSVSKEKRRAQAFTSFKNTTPLRNTRVEFHVQGGIYGKIVVFGTSVTDSNGYFQSPVLAGSRNFSTRLADHRLLWLQSTRADGTMIFAPRDPTMEKN